MVILPYNSPPPPGILVYILDSGAGGNLNKSAWARKRIQQEEDAQKQKEKEAASSVSSNVAGKDVFESGGSYSYTSPFRPNSAFHIRNRLLSKMGTTVSSSSTVAILLASSTYAAVSLLLRAVTLTQYWF